MNFSKIHMISMVWGILHAVDFHRKCGEMIEQSVYESCSISLRLFVISAC